MRTYAGLRKSCWALLHTSQELRLRQTPVPPKPNFENGDEVEGDFEVDRDHPSIETDSDDQLHNSPRSSRRARLT